MAGAILVMPAFSPDANAQAASPQGAQEQPAQQQPAEQQQPEVQEFNLEGDLALWSVAINPASTADYEQVLNRVKQVLMQQGTPEAMQQAAGWRVLKADMAMQNGQIVYTHIIEPVPGADYNILQVLYKTITDPTEQKMLYDLYRGAFAGNLGIATGAVVVDMAK